MENKNDFFMNDGYVNQHSRRKFIGTLALTAGLSGLGGPMFAGSALKAGDKTSTDVNKWFDKIKGTSRAVLDVPDPNEIFPFAWPRVFLLTNEMAGTPARDCTVVVVLRHTAIPFAMETSLWEKYRFGEAFNFNDPATQMPSLRNPFWKPGPNDFEVPGIGPVEIGINQLQDSGVMFCVCNMAITVYSAAIADKMEANPETVKNDFIAGLLPGIQVVPSGVWALGKAQQKGCSYIFAG